MFSDFIAERFGSQGYIGEALWIGHLGNFAVILSFSMALLAMVAFAFGTAERDQKKSFWRQIGRFAFYTHGFSVIAIFSLLFYMIFNHHFEYHYAWSHSSTSLPLEYIVSCFWEGQEGSFLLWQLWHVILGHVLIRRAAEYEAPVMSVVSLAQVLLGSMLLGIYVLGYKIGSNPFLLLRDVMWEAPIFANKGYLPLIQDGNGLNPLLQNYWMVIHPPVLFLGFAATVVPFAYAFASLWVNDYRNWVKPALSWMLFSSVTLGTGILMGGAWAYESLSFGGFWAWDPVENASLVPWLTSIAGLHTLVVYKSTKRGLVFTYLLTFASFLFILLSTFLTRSGILGDTSVHSFTDLGMSGQLIVYIMVFLVPSIALLMFRWNRMPKPKDEEDFFSREFWMFIGAIILSLSAAQIIFSTCLPIWNILLDKKWALADPVEYYNKWQVWFAVIIAFSSAVNQYLVYKRPNITKSLKQLVLPTVIAIVCAIGMVIWQEIYEIAYVLLLFCSVYTVIANLNYFVSVLKGRWSIAGGSITHFGFGIMMVGILISQYNKETISLNQMGIDFGEGFKGNEKLENILLLKDSMTTMGEYQLKYVRDIPAPPNTLYEIEYRKIDEETGEVKETFNLYPNAQVNPKMGLVSNPSTRRYLTKDIFTHVTSVPDKSQDLDTFSIHKVSVGDTFFTSRYYVVFESMIPSPQVDSIEQKPGIISVGARLNIRGFDETTEVLEPVYSIDANQGNQITRYPAVSDKTGLSITIREILPELEKFVFFARETEPGGDFIIMKAIVFPYINLLWLGSIICIIGFVVSIRRRSAENRRNTVTSS